MMSPLRRLRVSSCPRVEIVEGMKRDEEGYENETLAYTYAGSPLLTPLPSTTYAGGNVE